MVRSFSGGLTVFRSFSTIAAVIFLCLAVPGRARAGFTLSPFAGMSGTTMVFFFADMLTEGEGKFMETAGDYGFISGELGCAAALHTDKTGIRIEALWGYYSYNALDLPSKTYDMFMAGIEPYVLFSKMSLMAGGGIFRGFIHEEVLGRKTGSSRDNRGYAAWIGCGYLPFDFIEINLRVRWHHFTRIEREESDEHELLDDIVLVLRGMIHLRLL